MSIHFDQEKKIVHLSNNQISYVLEVIDDTYLINRYFGQAITKYRNSNTFQYFKRGFVTNHDTPIDHLSFDNFPFEYPSRGYGDYRIPALSITQSSGVEHVRLSFKSWKTLDHKPKITGMPATFSNEGDTETLEVICEDVVAKVRVYMYYTIFNELGIIARHQKIENFGEEDITINTIKSISLELPAKSYDFLSLYGTHIHEANINRFPLHQGIQKIESTRGISSAQHQPFFALLSSNTNEHMGEVYAFHLVYSGNFSGEVEKDQFGNIRAQLGINADTFKWTLHPKEVFETPEAILNYSNTGLNGMSQNFHSLYKRNLMPQRFMNKERPILLNSWEAMYYDVSTEKIEEQAELARKLGIELYVLDDGWFRKTNTSLTDMGDWKCNEKKLPGGITQVAKMIHDKGMQFGLWFEPEMLSLRSDIFKEKPEWALQIPGYPMIEGRGSYVLDLTRIDVQDHIIEMFDNYLKNQQIDYLKWDMNRPLTEVNSLLSKAHQKGEEWHRYVLGLYRIIDVITKKYPAVLIEGCSSGGGRFDPGMLYYTPQVWASDNTDAYDRTSIQSGYSLLYPPIAIGAHVSTVPNHQTGRVISVDTRYHVARFGNLGYELDLTKSSDKELQQITKQIKEVKETRSILQKGDFYRHEVPNDNYLMWSIVDPKKEEFLVMVFQKMHNPEKGNGVFKILYLDPKQEYEEVSSGNVYGGDELMYVGLSIPLVKEDFHTFCYHFKVHNK